MLYFAYGSCMDPDSFTRTVDPKYYTVIGSAVLRDYELLFTCFSTKRNGGVADVVSLKGAHVEGVLYDLKEEALMPLDEREGVPYGVYQRMDVQLCVQDKTVDAFTYSVVDKMAEEMAPSLDYAQLIYNGAMRHLSLAYRKQLVTTWKEKFGIGHFLELEKKQLK